MAVEKIEEYKQQNGVDILKVILKPTAKFPEGSNFFYAPADAIGLVRQYTWFLGAHRKNQVYVIAHDNDSTYYETGRCHQDTIQFHTKLFEYYNNYVWQGDIDHRDLVEYDNTDQNLEPVTRQQNKLNVFSRSYHIDIRLNPASFTAKFGIDGKSYYPYNSVRNEAEVCNLQNYLEKVWLQEKLGTQYYMFNFLKYRRGSEDILDLERTGVISEEEATYRHVMKYANNAWYYLRYGLQDYFQQYHIPVPKYKIDEVGFMRHPVTNQLLCPFH